MRFLKISIIACVYFAFAKAYSQQPIQDTSESLSLQQAITYGLDNNYQAINAKREMAKALKQKWITTSAGLPQINGTIDYQYQIKQPITPLPAEIAGGTPGTFIPVAFSPRQSATLGATLQQLIFDGSYIVALQASETFLDFSKNADNKTKLEVRKGIINAYGGVLLTQENIAIIKRNKTAVDDNLFETRKIFENGLAEQEDVEQLEITQAQLNNQLNSALRQEDIALDMLKLALGMDLDTPLTLTDSLESLAVSNLDPTVENTPLLMENNADYQIAYNFTEQRRLEWKLERSKALPTIGAFISAGTQTFDEDFVFFDNDQKWFPQSIAGLSINVPIFSSLGRKASTDKAKIAWDQAETELTQTMQQIKLDYQAAVNNYKIAVDNYTTSKDNLALAERIENKNEIKFKEGIATSFDLRQAQTQLYSTQAAYLNSMFSVISEKANLETILNTPNFNKNTTN